MPAKRSKGPPLAIPLVVVPSGQTFLSWVGNLLGWRERCAALYAGAGVDRAAGRARGAAERERLRLEAAFLEDRSHRRICFVEFADGHFTDIGHRLVSAQH